MKFGIDRSPRSRFRDRSGAAPAPPLATCPCGDPGCQWTVDDVAEEFAWDQWAEPVLHAEVCAATAWLLDSRRPCPHLLAHVDSSIQRFAPRAREYPVDVAARAVVQAINTWRGCPSRHCYQEQLHTHLHPDAG